MSELSDIAKNTATAQVDEHFNINEAVIGADCVHACAGVKHPHLNLTYFSNGQSHHVEIPYISEKVTHAEQGVLVQSS